MLIAAIVIVPVSATVYVTAHAMAIVQAMAKVLVKASADNRTVDVKAAIADSLLSNMQVNRLAAMVVAAVKHETL
jgi:hypothetical protein